ncbi:Dabb family protein [Tateyamaria sp. SN6-1]|uniref:Dabb family protein n=1 Tax=Tateyamaria sp. SN6-1 TaxID=3092148 RepID=UPI0039F5B886
MIRHCVFLNLSSGADMGALDKVMQGLEALVDDLIGCSDFVHGPNRDFENTSPEHRYGFTLDAADAETLATYANDPRHKELGGQLVALCEGGERGIVVYDIEGD